MAQDDVGANEIDDDKPLTEQDMADLMLAEGLGAKAQDAGAPPLERVELSASELAAIKDLAREGTAFEEIPVEISVILGTADVEIVNLLKVGRGAVIELNRELGEPLELRCQGRRIAEGEIVIKDNNMLAINITQMLGKRNSDSD